MNNSKIKIIGFSILFIVLGIGYYLYSTSLAEDFNDIDYTEVNRVGDAYTGVFHRPTCPKTEVIKYGKDEFENSEAALAAGYSPCKRCKPTEDIK